MTTRVKRFQATRLLPQLVAALLFSPGVLALSPELRLGQLYHTAWTAADGAPTGVEALAQTSEGYLWVAAAAGLFRFDGARFERIDTVRGQRLPSSNIMTLYAPRAGGLWIGYRFGGASFIKDGRITHYGASEGLPGGSVTGFAVDNSQVVWATTTWGLKRLDGSLWEDVTEELNLPSEYVKSLSVARNGTLWIVIGHDVMSLQAGDSVFRASDIQTSEGAVDFVEAPDGTLWLTDSNLGARAVYSPNGDTRVLRRWIALRDPQGEGLWGKLIDRDGTLWMASPRGIHRSRDFTGAQREVFSDADGLSAPYAAAFLEDREGNVWIGTAGGLDRFRESRLTPVSLPVAASGFALAAADAGDMMIGIAADAGDVSAFRVTAGSETTAMRGPRYIDAAYRAANGVIWLGGRGMLWHSSGSPERLQWTAVTIPVDRDHADYYPVQGITEDRAGGLWVSVVRGGVMRFFDGRWTNVGDPPLSIASGEDGRIWLGYPRSRVQVREPDTTLVREFSVAEGLDLGNIQAMLARPRDAFVGGELGLAYFDGERFHTVTQQGGRQLPSVSGIVATAEGDLWLNTSDGAMKVAAAEVQRLAADTHHPIQYELFNFLDGMPGAPVSLRPLPSIAAGTDGRLWFATSNGVVWIDPKHRQRNAVAPTVEVQAIVADGVRHAPAQNLRLPIGPRDVQITYTALSLSIPERVRFRYQLGAGEPWQDAGTRRAAYFTNLDPGNYTFRVAAANEDGVWNEAGTSIEFTIPPAFYQTLWFYALCALALLGVLTILYRVRVHQVAAQVRGRLEARLAERERIARDLHDTLLQGMQGLIWRFQAATDRIPQSEPARQLMEQSLDRADKLLGESRDKVKDLRPAGSDTADLAKALAAEGEEFAQLHGALFKVTVEGASRDLHPIVREEGLLIGREALSNAFRHARARNIEAEVSFGDSALHVRIRDDGLGISSTVLEAGGTPGHFGLVGMRERAKKLGAHLEVWSKPGAGTEVDLRVPADVAYKRSPAESHGIRSWLGATQ